MNTKPKILIAEDDNCNYRLLDVMLRNNYELVWAHNGQEAMAYALSNDDVELVLMDNKMPVMNGLEALKAIKRQKPNLPVVMQTAFVFDSNRHEALCAGADGYVTKPVRAATLFEEIRKALSHEREHTN